MEGKSVSQNAVFSKAFRKKKRLSAIPETGRRTAYVVLDTQCGQDALVQLWHVVAPFLVDSMLFDEVALYGA